MNDEFMSLRSRVAKLHKQFDALLGHGYGRKSGEPTARRVYRIRAGQAFWQEITGDPDFYLKLINAMQDYPTKHREQFDTEFDKALGRFTLEFAQEFIHPDGSIDWSKLTQLNSGVDAVPKPKRPKTIGQPEARFALANSDDSEEVIDEDIDADDDILEDVVD